MEETSAVAARSGRRDLRNEDVSAALAHAERALGTRIDARTLVRKRRSVGGRTGRATWLRLELRSWATLAVQGQPHDGVEASAYLPGIAKPRWHGAASWPDEDGRSVWRVDEMDLVDAAPVRTGGPVPLGLDLSDAWWAALNASLDALGAAHTARVATPDTRPMTQELVTRTVESVFPGLVDTRIDHHDWVPAHADLNWSNITAPELHILDWEDHGLAPRGLDSATLWADSWGRPHLAARVRHERRTDLESRGGRIMTLFTCAKILDDTLAPSSVAEAARRVSRDLLGEF
jgi:hypothetical protein